MRKCVNTTCPKHGIKLQGRYCPACGTETFLIPLFPFAVYVPRSAIYTSMVPFFLFLFITFIIVPGISSCRSHRQEIETRRQFLISELPENWNKLYRMIDMLNYADRKSFFLKRYEETNGFANWPPLMPEQIQFILDEFYSNELPEIAKCLCKEK